MTGDGTAFAMAKLGSGFLCNQGRGRFSWCIDPDSTFPQFGPEHESDEPQNAIASDTRLTVDGNETYRAHVPE